MSFNYNHKWNVLVSRKEIKQLISKIAKQINHDYKGKCPIIVGLLNGSIPFMAELILKLHIELEVEPIKIFTYSKTSEKKLKTERIKQFYDWKRLHGRHVIVLDELIDSGDTVDYITKRIARRCHPKSIKVVALFMKDRKRPFNVKPNYLGKMIPDKWITGYGMGYKYKCRNLNKIVILSEKEKETL